MELSQQIQLFKERVNGNDTNLQVMMELQDEIFLTVKQTFENPVLNKTTDFFDLMKLNFEIGNLICRLIKRASEKCIMTTKPESV